MLTQERLKEIVHYDPSTGIFTWAKSRPACRKGDECGRVSMYGYREIGVDGTLHFAHRLAFLYMEGAWPENNVDHINRDRLDNRWRNLRPCNQSQNMGNVGLRKNNTSGHAGVTWDKRYQCWRAQIRLSGKKVNLGRFATLADAAAAHDAAHARNFGEFSNAA